MDNNIFESGWSRQNAYVFGWIMSDGCLTLEGRNKTSYAVKISSNDLDIISWLHNYMCVGNKIYRQNERNYMIKFRNQDSIRFMMNNKLTERKSLTAEMPDVPKEYMSDFIRGYFDGNGSVITRKTKHNTYGQVSITSGSKGLLLSLAEELKIVGIDSKIYMDGRSTNQSCYLRIIKRSEIEKMYVYMYSGVDQNLMLRRKYEKYTQLMECKPKYNISQIV